MEYVEGKSLAVVLAECGYIAPERAVNVFMQVCEAVEHAHRHGVVHRDLKPSNMIVTGSSYYVKIVDFGIAKVLGENSGETQLTQTGEVFGSPSYMSPEQCTGNQVDGRSDIYSIGCVMYETVVGMVPFPGDNPVQVIVKHLNEPPPSFQKARPGCQIPRGLENVVMNALAKQPMP
jgi:serine/threonine protein kinase